MIDLILIPAGSFLMGCDKEDGGGYEDEHPQHDVDVPSFWMGKYPITQEQYQQVRNPTDESGGLKKS